VLAARMFKRFVGAFVLAFALFADSSIVVAQTVPALAACVAAPTTAGCSTVLPTLLKCIATPGLEGCTVVLPTIAQCTATPSLAGCVAVLPPKKPVQVVPVLPLAAIPPAGAAKPPGAPGLYVEVIAGQIAVNNTGGAQTFAAGQFGYVPNTQTQPIIVPAPTGVAPPLTFAVCSSQPLAQTGCAAILPNLATRKVNGSLQGVCRRPRPREVRGAGSGGLPVQGPRSHNRLLTVVHEAMRAFVRGPSPSASGADCGRIHSVGAWPYGGARWKLPRVARPSHTRRHGLAEREWEQ
jgi:hypothetical protein